MERIEYTREKDPTWPPGPWMDEPDKIQWPDEETGLPCLVNRNYTGVWCGYVGVSPGHPAYGMDYGTAEDRFDLRAHGSLTFSDSCMKDAPEDSGVCHVPGPGEPDDVWWLGFDCGHAFDLVPGMIRLFDEIEADMKKLGVPEDMFIDVYRPLEYAQEQCRELARQLKGVEGRPVAGAERPPTGGEPAGGKDPTGGPNVAPGTGQRNQRKG